MSWLEIKCLSPEGTDPAILTEIGAAGISSVKDAILCWLNSEEFNPDNFCKQASELGFEVLSSAPLKEHNWVARCEALWKPIECGELSIYPIMDDTIPDDADSKNTIYLHPGAGFGTGHHPTTYLMLKMMQDTEVLGSTPLRVLDAGTGSGVLSIVAGKLWDADICGYDIDESALNNAWLNIRLNNAQGIKLLQGDTGSVQGQFNLILANIYRDVLIEEAGRLTDLAAGNSILIISGFRESEIEVIRKAFDHYGDRIKELSIDGWSALAYKVKKS